MSVTYGRSSGMPFAQYDPDSHYWKTCADTSLWDLMLSSLTLPSWGYLLDGVLYELPTPELLTIERGSLSWLATPTAWLGHRPAHSIGDPDRWKDPNRSNELSDQIAAMLPTPTVQASKHITMDDRGPGTLDDHNLWSVIGRLLPTPAVNDMGAGKDPEIWEAWTEKMKMVHGNSNGHGKSLEQEALKMLPTPVASDCQDRQSSENWKGHDLVSTVKQIGENTKRRSADGNPSSKDHPPLLPFEETIEID